jgi:hypothetical protein
VAGPITSPAAAVGTGTHHHENNTAFVPTTNPADAPAINAIANGDFSEEPQKLSLN